MSRIVKSLVIFTISLLLFYTGNTQSKASPQKTNITADIKKVVDDYPNQFANIKGELIIENPQSADYRCKLEIKNVEQSFITRYSSEKKAIYSWQALVQTTENFEDAVKKFKSLYEQLNNCQMKSAKLRGIYESPVEEKKFTSVLFSFDTDNELMKNLKLELVIENELLQWKVKIILYDRDREDDEQGNVIEE